MVSFKLNGIESPCMKSASYKGTSRREEEHMYADCLLKYTSTKHNKKSLKIPKG